MKAMLRNMVGNMRLYRNLIEEIISYAKRLFLYNASVHTDDDIAKMQYTILRENHVIEKGMSLRNPRKGFGQQKVTALLHRLEKYYTRYGKIDSQFLIYPLSTIKSYIAYTEAAGVDISAIKKLYAQVLSGAHINENLLVSTAGIKLVTKKELTCQAAGNFRDLLFSRHSVRYYAKTAVDKKIIEQALSMAQQTPSACNRQGWRTHIYFGEQAHDLLHMQGGCNGFENEIPCAIVVTADMRAFLSYEPMQCYVDGGLYAMNLINALHSLGLGTIPLSLGFYHTKLSCIAKTFDIPSEEAMICIIGVGELLDTFNVAESYRKHIQTTNTYH